MKRDFRTVMILLAFSLPVLALAFIGTLYFANCGFNADCTSASLAPILHTPIPTLIPATLPVPTSGGPVAAGPAKCPVAAETILSAWVSAGYSETKPFTFTGTNNASCTATFADVQPLFTESNLWYSGAQACVTCHNAGLSPAYAQLDLSSYAGILAGSHRASASAKGNDLLGAGNWDQSKLNQMLFVQKLMPFGRPPGAVSDQGPVILAGKSVSGVAAATSTGPTPAGTEEVEVPAPSNPGGPGAAVNLTGDATAGVQVYQSNCALCHGDQGKGGVPNPGSTDGTVPPLNPIDPGLVNPDYNTFARNIDLFLEHGSVPEGTNPAYSMPAWGDQGLLSPQKIADVIAYVTGLNGVQAAAPAATPVTTEEAEVPAPSNPGGPGAAISLTGDATAGAQVYQSNCALCHSDQGKGDVPNPGSTDGTVPPLNPIDPGLVSPDYNIFARNIDLFIQHGSTPEGTNPAFSMPAWGDQGLLSQQKIADVIAYVIGLNGVQAAVPTSTPATTEEVEVPAPSNPGGPGAAVNLTGDVAAGTKIYQTNCALCHGDQAKGGVPNPGSTDGTVPPLNPIDPGLVNKDPLVFAKNVDLFIEHGSTPEGTNPAFSMPAWGDQNLLAPQQIADVIAYIISLNK
jgi:mono/diheme cytochrome c family protein